MDLSDSENLVVSVNLTDMITSLDLMTSTASLASKNIKKTACTLHSEKPQ